MAMDPSGTDVEPVDGWPVTKPGFQSSEWWTAVGTSLITTAVAVAALFGRHLNGSALTTIVGAVAILGPAIASAFYSISRGNVKAAAHAASARRLINVSQMGLAASPIREVGSPSPFTPTP